MSDSTIEQEAPDPRFSSFVYFQAQNGGLFLGRIPNPTTGEASVNIKAARSVLDALEMLSDKSKGNLNPALRTGLGKLLGPWPEKHKFR